MAVNMKYVNLFEKVACKQTYKMAEGVEAVVKQVRVDTLLDLRSAIQPDGLINSDAGVKTIKAITSAIDKIIKDNEIQEK